MASPHIEVVFIYDNAGAPLTGLSPTFLTYKDDLGFDLAQPAITEIGGGAYKFTPVFTADRAIVYVMTTGGYPATYAKFMRPEDFNIDNVGGSAAIEDLEQKVDELIQYQTGKWEIKTNGPDANRLIIYEADGIAVLKKYNLFDSQGLPTAINPFRREPL